MLGYIYIVENSINNKQYIGKRTGQFDKNYYGSGIIVSQAIKKYGKDKFSVKILEYCDSQETLNQREKYFIEKLKPIYNIAAGGDGGHVLKYADKEYIEEIYDRQSKAMQNTWKNLSPDERKAWGESISKSRKGSNGRTGTRHSEETKKKISDSNKLAVLKRPDTWKENHKIASEKRKGISNSACNKIIFVDGVEYKSVKSALNTLQISRPKLMNYIKKERAYYGK
jgi:group I intron endonuclease